MNRRDFIARTGLAAAALTMAPTTAASQDGAPAARKAGRFKLKYAPGLGQLAFQVLVLLLGALGALLLG